MLPQNHFAIAALVIAPLTLIFFPEKVVVEVGLWVLIGGLLSATIDLDIITLVRLKSKSENRLKPFTDPREIFRKFDLFMDTIYETGVLAIAMKTHVIFSTFIMILFYLSWRSYFMPVALGVGSHLASDIPNFKRILR